MHSSSLKCHGALQREFVAIVGQWDIGEGVCGNCETVGHCRGSLWQLWDSRTLQREFVAIVGHIVHIVCVAQ